MEKFIKIVNELESKITYFDKFNSKISSTNVGWHIEHSLITIRLIIKSLELSNPDNYKSKFNFARTLVYTINMIPRGRGKAPKIVVPQGEITKESLIANFKIIRAKIDTLKSYEKNKFREHPYFGHLNLKSTIKFLGIHTNHHLKIIKDIIKNS